MNRRKFLDATIKTISAASCTPFFTSELHAHTPPQSATTQSQSNAPRPQLAITMDDPRLKLESNLRW
jgi:hypothetical protein